jgi:hypothetical protein
MTSMPMILFPMLLALPLVVCSLFRPEIHPYPIIPDLTKASGRYGRYGAYVNIGQTRSSCIVSVFLASADARNEVLP